MKRDENGVILPVKTTYPASEIPPTDFKFDDDKSLKNSAANNELKDNKKSENKMPIDSEEISKADTELKKYIASKKRYDLRYKKNFDDYNLMYTENTDEQYIKTESGEIKKALIPRKKGAQCLNVIMNKHADAMDNYPEIICLPRAKDDEKTAETLNSVLPCIHKRNGHFKVYSDVVLDKFVGGCGAYSVTWDSTKDNGLGDISIARADIMKLFWQDHIENIQDSKYLFYLDYKDIDEIKEIYPELEEASIESFGLEEYTTYDNTTKSNQKATIVDWYYKKNGKLHFCKYVGEHILFSSENEAEKGDKSYTDGFYHHGLYPFVLEPMFKLRDTPVGFGFIDVCRAPQNYLDDLKVDILTNCKVNSQPRVLVNDGSGINIDDLADLTKSVVKTSGDPRNCTLPIESKDLAGGSLSVYKSLIDEIKETSATNDASNGASAAGVTSGNAIAALQEAGGKVSRDSNKLSMECTTEIAHMEIELIRQFYTLPRVFRITGDNNQTEYIEFDNSSLMKQNLDYTDENGDVLQRLPIFDIDVKAQKANPFATVAQNDMMMALFKMGAFNPDMADSAIIMFEGMNFEGKDKILQMVRENQALAKAVQEMGNKISMLEAMNAQKNAMSVQDLPGQGQMPAVNEPMT